MTLAAALNQRVRTMPAAGGGVVVLGVWCPVCQEEQGPMRDGSCPFCNTLIYDEDALTAKQAIAALDTPRPGGTMTTTAAHAVCKIDGCEETAEDRVGMYAKLCPEHKQDAKQRRSATPRSPRSSVGATDTLTARVQALVPLARRFDRARAKLSELPSNEAAKAAFDEATRRASATPSVENLARVTAATKALANFAPRRTKLEIAAAEAERDFLVIAETLAAA